MTHDDLLRELLELIKLYQQIIYNYRQYPNYKHSEYTWEEAEKRLEYYRLEYYTNLYANELK